MAGNLANTQELVEVDRIENGVVVLKSGVLRQIIMVGGINFSLKSEQEQNIITQAYQEFLNGLNFAIQIIVHSRKINIERYLRSLDERKEKEVSGLLQDQIAEYQSFIRQFVSENAVMAKTFFVVVPFHPIHAAVPSGDAVLGFLPFLKKKSAPQKTTEQKALLKEDVIQLVQRTNQVVEGLQRVGLEVLVLNDEQLTELFYNFYNPETVEKEKVL